jgi:hypothetical protein
MLSCAASCLECKLASTGYFLHLADIRIRAAWHGKEQIKLMSTFSVDLGRYAGTPSRESADAVVRKLIICIFPNL